MVFRKLSWYNLVTQSALLEQSVLQSVARGLTIESSLRDFTLSHYPEMVTPICAICNLTSHKFELKNTSNKQNFPPNKMKDKYAETT